MFNRYGLADCNGASTTRTGAAAERVVVAAPPTPPQWANRRQTAFAALLPLAFVGTVCAQTAQERADISASSNRDALVRMEAQHRLQRRLMRSVRDICKEILRCRNA